VPVAVADVTVKIVESALGRVSGPCGGRATTTLKSPFPDDRGGVSSLFQDRGERVVVFEGFVELVVADIGMALVNAGQQRATSWRTDRSSGVMGTKLNPLRGHRIELGGCEFLRAAPTVLIEHAEVAIAEIVAEDEYHIRSLASGHEGEE